jgi:hypothetical protein
MKGIHGVKGERDRERQAQISQAHAGGNKKVSHRQRRYAEETGWREAA